MSACGDLCGWMHCRKTAHDDRLQPDVVALTVAAELGRQSIALRHHPYVRGSVAMRWNNVTTSCFVFHPDMSREWMNEWMNEWMMFVSWRGRLVFCAPAGLPALLFVSRQRLWEWSGEWLPVAWRGPFWLSSKALTQAVAWLSEGSSIKGGVRKENCCKKSGHWLYGCSHMSFYRFLIVLFLLFVWSLLILAFKMSIILFVKCLPASRLTFFRLPTFLWFGTCNHWILAYLLWFKNCEVS